MKIPLAIVLLVLAYPAHAQDSGLETWRKIHDVFSHARCANCHVGSDNRPMWSEAGRLSLRPHGMNINAGESRVGAETLPCGTCHGETNAQISHGPPGAETWLLPPAEMQWFGKTSAEIARRSRIPSAMVDAASRRLRSISATTSWFIGGGRPVPDARPPPTRRSSWRPSFGNGRRKARLAQRSKTAECANTTHGS